jgi:hypothetical protein
VIVSALTAGDFWLWNWSLSANRDALALVSGLTLLPLAAASVLLFVLTAARLASRLGWRGVGTRAFRRTARRTLADRSGSRPIGASGVLVGDPKLAFDSVEPDSGVDGVAAGGARVAKPARKLAA